MQKQIKISLSENLSEFVISKSKELGIPATQFVKYLIIQNKENSLTPEFEASRKTIEATEKALEDYKNAIEINDIDELDKLCE